MKKSILFKAGILIVVMALSYGNIQAQCDQSDDFWTSFGTYSILDDTLITQNGWTAYSQEDYTLIGGGSGIDNYDEGITITTVYAGCRAFISSPIFNNGCESIKFSYKEPIWLPTDMKVEIKQNNTVVWDSVVPTFTIGQGDGYRAFSVDNLNIEGEYQLVISNISADFSMLVVKDICLTDYIVIPEYTFAFHVPKNATVFVGEKDQNVTVAGNYLKKHYIPFTEKPAVYISETDTGCIWYYNVSKMHNYRVRSDEGITQVGTFTPRAGDSVRVFTEVQLMTYGPKEIDHDVTHLAGRNVADVFLNINSKGHLTLPLQADTSFQLVHCRNWQAIDTDVNNYFIDPDFHYEVVNELGEPDQSVVSISERGEITPVGIGTAIVLVTYDAMLCYHTTNVGGVPALFSALWPENTGVFVVSVGAAESGIQSNMLINEYWSNINGTDKVDSTFIDAEHDVFYFESEKGSFPYSFKPEGVSEVLLATPKVEQNTLSYSGFSKDSVALNDDGTYTVRLSFGRNIVKLVSESGVDYQVITAKPVDYTIANVTHPDENILPGDEVSVLFNTLYHPSNKLSGIYNMSAGIQYTGNETNFPLILGPGQYTFASRAQEYKVTVPEDYTDECFDLTNGVIKVKGFGSFYGEHRKITLQSGVAPNLNASVRTGYFGVLPDITIPLGRVSGVSDAKLDLFSVYPNPFIDHLVIRSEVDSTVVMFDVTGKIVCHEAISAGTNKIVTSHLPKGIYFVRLGSELFKVIK